MCVRAFVRAFTYMVISIDKSYLFFFFYGNYQFTFYLKNWKNTVRYFVFRDDNSTLEGNELQQRLNSNSTYLFLSKPHKRQMSLQSSESDVTIHCQTRIKCVY